MTAKKLLLVDDEPLVRRSMQKTLVRAGFDVEAAGGCAEGLEFFDAAQAAGTAFDLAVLDINMPGFDGAEHSGAGLELLSRLLEQRPDLPVIMLSAYDEVNKAKDAVSRGARAYTVKGREQGLLDVINQILGS
jgi:two-component system nitrogen regulation response regulator GlnG